MKHSYFALVPFYLLINALCATDGAQINANPAKYAQHLLNLQSALA